MRIDGREADCRRSEATGMTAFRPARSDRLVAIKTRMMSDSSEIIRWKAITAN